MEDQGPYHSCHSDVIVIDNEGTPDNVIVIDVEGEVTEHFTGSVNDVIANIQGNVAENEEVPDNDVLALGDDTNGSCIF